MIIQVRPIALIVILLFTACSLAVSDETRAQTAPRQIALRSGESIDLYSVYYVANCRSIMIGLPDIEMLEGPPELTLSIREEPVLPRRQGCAGKVPGGTLMLVAKKVTEPVEAKLTIRVNYKTKDGPRQTSNSYVVSLFP